MKLGFGPKYFLKCVLTDSVNNSILKKIDFGLNGPDRVTYVTCSGETGNKSPGRCFSFQLYNIAQPIQALPYAVSQNNTQSIHAEHS